MESLFTAESANLDQYKQSLVRTIVCEFRFPTLLELGEAKPPIDFARSLRKSYPNLERGNELSIGASGTGSTFFHVFRSIKGGWSISLKPNSVAIEGTHYKGFSELLKRAAELVPAAEKIIDSTFFTRIGLRYINVIDQPADPIGEGWINPSLVAPVLEGNARGISDYSGRLAAGDEEKGFLLQHGLRFAAADLDAKEQRPQYVIDIDVYQQEVEVSDSISVIERLHSSAFQIFDWSLGDAARNFLRG
ncbi:TIGR04255 family protein [Stenotrophomonas sp. YIM B06876]|uniref:TIGR04255 family protein n=1 Tax=Stenotrophomonas sp. YIM B06876 TaxID=3060211 RepID=UPI002738333C|nr:TIGR04255 family protein [Stenotrophomonas sp. YIM B06876]